MKNNFLWTMAAALALVGCSETELLDTPQALEQNAITFDTYVGDNAQTRAVVIDKDVLGVKGFGVNAYYTAQDDYAKGAELNFMQNTKVTFNPDKDAWTYSPVKYWPNNAGDMVSFFAYGPFANNGNANNIDLQGTNINFTVNNDVKQQVDLVYNTNYAGTINQVKQAVNERIHFQFGHALARIAFTVEAAVDETTAGNNLLDGNTRINVKKVALVSDAGYDEANLTGPFYTGGTLSLLDPGTTEDGTPISPWSSTTGEQGFVFNATAHFYHTVKDKDAEYPDGEEIDVVQLTRFNASEPQRLLNDDSYLMIIPQETSFKIYIEYDVISGGYENNGGGVYDESAIVNKITSTEALTVNFEKGKAYNFNLVLGMTSVKFEVDEVTEWDEQPSEDEWLPENKDNENTEQLLLNSSTLLMTPYDTYQLSATTSTQMAALYTRSEGLTVTYRSTDESIATVTPQGLITAGATGNKSCQIIAEYNGLSASCDVNIAPDFKDVELTNKIETANIPAANVVWTMGDGSWEDNPAHFVKLTEDYYMSRREISIKQFVEFLNAHKKYFHREYYEEEEHMVGTSDGDEEVDYVEPAHYRIRFDAGEENYVFCKEHVNGLEYTDGNGWTIKSGYENRPAIVTWEGATMFAKCVGGELPTEAQWEYAARAGGDNSDGYWFDQDNVFSSTYDEGTDSWLYSNVTNYEQLIGGEEKNQFEENVLTNTFRVVSGEGATSECNAWGLYDLYGNIRELCANQDYPYPIGTTLENPAIDPKGEFYSPGEHITAYSVRGGDYTDHPGNAVTHFERRLEYSPANLDGFRVIFRTDHLNNMTQTKTNTAQ